MTIHSPPFEDEDLYQPNKHDSYRMQRPTRDGYYLDLPITEVLVIEDSPSCIESIEQALRSVIGIDTFHVVQDWVSAQEALSRDKYDLILLDKNIPESVDTGKVMNAYEQVNAILDKQKALLIGTSSEDIDLSGAVGTIDKARSAIEDLHVALREYFVDT